MCVVRQGIKYISVAAFILEEEEEVVFTRENRGGSALGEKDSIRLTEFHVGRAPFTCMIS